MSDTQQKTHEEIIAEMRIFKCRNLETGELELCSAIANYFADRLEAACKHELEAKESVIQTLAAELQAERANTAKIIGVLESANEHASKIMAITTVPELYATNMDAVRHHAVEIGFHAAEAVSEIKAEVNE